MYSLNASIRDIPVPDRLRRRPVSETGYPVPWFVSWHRGVPDFRLVDPAAIGRAHRAGLCWLCGQRLGRYRTFVIGPMCAINRTSSEPPSHRECAEYAVMACPFLTRPKMRRNDKDLPTDIRSPGGIMLARNPGVTLIWVTRDYGMFRVANGRLFRIGDPEHVAFYAEGRAATRSEVMASIDSGLPELRKIAEQEGADAMAALSKQVAAAMVLINDAVSPWAQVTP